MKLQMSQNIDKIIALGLLILCIFLTIDMSYFFLIPTVLVSISIGKYFEEKGYWSRRRDK